MAKTCLISCSFVIYLLPLLPEDVTMTKRQYITVLLLSLLAMTAVSQPSYTVMRYDEDNGLPHAHVTQLLQDRSGFMWFSTWNGLCRYDGYEFQTFKPQAGDGCHMASDRIRNIWLTADGDICCKSDDDLFLFDMHSYRFRDITDSIGRDAATEGRRHARERGHFNGSHFEFTDRQGLLWQLRSDALYCLRPMLQPAVPVVQRQPAQIRCLARDGEGRIWITTREDATVRLFDASLNPLGYLGADGHIHQGYVSFGQPVYCVTPTRDGMIWLGSKPGGLYRYDSRRQQLQHIDGLPHEAVYDVKEDRRGRLWIATLGGGILCKDGDSVSQFLAPLKVRYIHLTPDDVLLAATTEGLVVGKIEENIKNIRFQRHLRDANRPGSLNCNATMDIIEDRGHRLLVSSESRGISELATANLLADTLSFRQLPMRGGWPTEVVLSMAAADGGDIVICGSNQLIVYNADEERGTTFDSWFFNHPYRFSEARPLRLADGRWLFGTMEGAFTLTAQDMHREPFVPNIALTSVTVQNGTTQYAVNHLDTLLLQPAERSLTVRFAALDFTGAHRVRYEFRLGDDQQAWNSIGHDHSVTLFDLGPGSYELWLRSTNADGIVVNNVRRVVIVVFPTFWESSLGRLLMVLLAAAVVGISVYTIIYIRRIKRKQHETLEAYLNLLEGSQDTAADSIPAPAADKGNDPMLQRVMAFIEENLSNSDASVGDMAAAAATSRSGLQRKLKQTMGITPQDLLREARIKRARQLLKTDRSVAEVAYACGFTDPKYFSRCFKQVTGQSPSEFKGK